MFSILKHYQFRRLQLKFHLLGVAAAIALSGCSTTSVPVREAVPAPQAQIYLKERLPVQGNARTIFVRDTGFIGSGVFQHIFIDGVKVASLNPGEKVELIVPPGEHILGVQPTDPFGTKTLMSIDQDLKADRTYFYRILTDGESFTSTVQRFLPEPPKP